MAVEEITGEEWAKRLRAALEGWATSAADGTAEPPILLISAAEVIVAAAHYWPAFTRVAGWHLPTEEWHPAGAARWAIYAVRLRDGETLRGALVDVAITADRAWRAPGEDLILPAVVHADATTCVRDPGATDEHH